jgi:hypothetical protein
MWHVAYYAMQFIHGQSLDAVIEDLRRYQEHGTISPAAGQTPHSERVRIAQSMLTRAFRPVGSPRTTDPSARRWASLAYPWLSCLWFNFLQWRSISRLPPFRPLRGSIHGGRRR